VNRAFSNDARLAAVLRQVSASNIAVTIAFEELPP